MRFGCVSLLVATLIAQSSQPTFRTGVELLRLDVTVLDKSGAPVRDLGAGDFVVKVDGKPRTVSFARFYGPEADQPATAATTAATAPPAFADNTGVAQGRVVILVVDLESMTPGYEKVVLDTAGSLIDRLGPDDSVGLILIPGKGIELTRDHARVRQALAGARGFAGASDRQHAISVREAEAFSRDDRRIISEVVERECRPSDQMCSHDLEREARELLVEADQHIRNVPDDAVGPEREDRAPGRAAHRRRAVGGPAIPAGQRLVLSRPQAPRGRVRHHHIRGPALSA